MFQDNVLPEYSRKIAIVYMRYASRLASGELSDEEEKLTTLVTDLLDELLWFEALSTYPELALLPAIAYAMGSNWEIIVVFEDDYFENAEEQKYNITQTAEAAEIHKKYLLN